jgi:pimeloyl-ACP methyl ester carboxylesterase
MNASVNGFDLVFDEFGERTAGQTTVLLIHGFPLNRNMWWPQSDALAAAGYHVVVPDLRGFGQSPIGDADATGGIDLLADDLVALLDHLEIDRVVAGGMSMGGYVLLNLLARYRERISAACFLVTRADADDETAQAKRNHLIDEINAGRPMAVADGFIQVLFAESTMEKNPELVEEVYRWLAHTDPAGLLLGLQAIRDRADSRAMLPGLSCPALVIGAGNDRAIPPACSEELALNIPGAELCLIENAGHMANLEQPHSFNQSLLRFLASLS